MLQVIGAVLVISSSTALGIANKQRLSKRVCIINDWIYTIDFITNEIGQNNTPLPEIVRALASQNNFSLSQLFCEMLKRTETQPDLSFGFHWHTTIRDFSISLCMEDEEVEVLRNTSAYLGRYQADMQISGLNNTKSKLNSIYNNALNAVKNKGNIYKMCGIALGIITVLMII